MPRRSKARKSVAMNKKPVLLGAFAPLLLGACATLPSGPSVMVLPGAQKTFEHFRADDALCQFYARQAVGGQTPTQTAMDSGTASAVAGTAVGAAAGAVIGAAAGEPAGGAAIGAGSGLLLEARPGPAPTRVGLRPAEPLRHHLRTMHVRQGEPGAGPRSISGCTFALSAPAAATQQRGSAACSTRRKATASPTRHTDAAQQSVKRILRPLAGSLVGSVNLPNRCSFFIRDYHAEKRFQQAHATCVHLEKARERNIR